MVLNLDDAVTILSKWKDDSAQILVVCESPFNNHVGVSLSKASIGR
jgi:hypothetical protein